MVSLNPKIASKLHWVDISGADSCSCCPGVLYVSDSGNNRIQKRGILDLSEDVLLLPEVLRLYGGFLKCSISTGISLRTHPFWGTPISGNLHVASYGILHCTKVAARGPLCCDSGRGQWQRLSFGAPR